MGFNPVILWLKGIVHPKINILSQWKKKKKTWPNSKNKATYLIQLKLTQLATDNLKSLVHLKNKSQSIEC